MGEIEARFWAKVALNEPDQCWIWMAGRRGKYGCVWNGNRAVAAHRLAYELAVGPIPDGHDVLHTCDIPLCVNPQHLWSGTALDNMLDMWRKGRGNPPIGERAPSNKLTFEQVCQIRKLLETGVSQRTIAMIFNVKQPTICHINTGKNWEDFK